MRKRDRVILAFCMVLLIAELVGLFTGELPMSPCVYSTGPSPCAEEPAPE